jgi:YHS domain-containing protein
MFMKNKALAILLTFALILAFSSTAVMAQEKPSEKKETCAMKADQGCCKEAMVCPVTGEAGNKEIFSEYKGQKVFFCCADCKAAFDKDPSKYEAKIHKCSGDCKKEGAEGCCKTGGKKACADSCGKALGGGKKCVKADSCCKVDAKKCEKAEGCCQKSMICPVSGKTGNKEIFSEYKGQKVFFCCLKAKEAFDKDPAKYEAKIHKCSGDCKKAGAEGCGKTLGGGKKCAKSDSCCKTEGKKPEKPAKK